MAPLSIWRYEVIALIIIIALVSPGSSTFFLRVDSPQITSVPELSDLSTIKELIAHENCEPSIHLLLLDGLTSAYFEKQHVQKLCQMFSYPRLREVLGPSFNPAWYPLTWKLVNALVEAALTSLIRKAPMDILNILSLFRNDMRTSGSGRNLVDLRNIAAPIGILPPELYHKEHLEDLLKYVARVETDRSAASLLQSFLTSGKLYEQLDDDFDASYYTTYGDLLAGITYHLESDNHMWKLMFSFLEKNKGPLKDLPFNPQLIHEMNLPPMSIKHDPFIKELVFTTIEPEYHVQARFLEEYLNNGRLLNRLGPIDLSKYDTKSDLLYHLVHGYIVALENELDPLYDIRNNVIRFLQNKINFSTSITDKVDQELVEALHSVKRNSVIYSCMRASDQLVDLFPFMSSSDMCKKLAHMNSKWEQVFIKND